MAQSEYGQQALPLETIGIGSVIYDATRDLQGYAKVQNIDFITEVKDANVMANREGLSAIIRCLSEIALTQPEDEQTGMHKVRIKVKSEQSKVSVTVVSNRLGVSDRELEAAKHLQGSAHLADARLSDSGIRLAIADALARSFDTRIFATKSNGMKGFGFELRSSMQLRLV